MESACLFLSSIEVVKEYFLVPRVGKLEVVEELSSTVPLFASGGIGSLGCEPFVPSPCTGLCVRLYFHGGRETIES